MQKFIFLWVRADFLLFQNSIAIHSIYDFTKFKLNSLGSFWERGWFLTLCGDAILICGAIIAYYRVITDYRKLVQNCPFLTHDHCTWLINKTSYFRDRSWHEHKRPIIGFLEEYASKWCVNRLFDQNHEPPFPHRQSHTYVGTVNLSITTTQGTGWWRSL